MSGSQHCENPLKKEIKWNFVLVFRVAILFNFSWYIKYHFRFEMAFRIVGLLVVINLAVPSTPSQSTHCYFNQLCTCKLQSGSGLNYSTTISTSGAVQSLMQAPVDIRDISCLGVPFGNIPGVWFVLYL